MLTEVKAKVTRLINGKNKTKTEAYLIESEVFAEAEIAVMTLLENQHDEGTVSDYQIQSLRISPIKEISTQYEGEMTYIATLKDIFTDDNGNEKYIRYQVLLWADNLTQANTRAVELFRQGYNMLVEGIKQKDFEYLPTNPEPPVTSENP